MVVPIAQVDALTLADEIEIRPAHARDLEAVRRLTHETTRVSYAPFLGHDPVEAFLESGEADRYLADNLDGSWVIVLGGRVVGIAITEDQVIGQLMIDHHYHRRGLGSQLLAHVETQLFRAFDVLELQSFEANDVANRFYLAHGWEEVERKVDADYGIPMIAFRKGSVRSRV